MGPTFVVPVRYSAKTELDFAGTDVRVSYDAILEGEASVVGVLQDDTFRAFDEHDAHRVRRG